MGMVEKCACVQFDTIELEVLVRTGGSLQNVNDLCLSL